MDVPADAGPDRSARRRRRAARQIERADNPLRVLVADDELLIRRALSRLLTARGHTVQTAQDAHEAIDLLDRETFDVVLVDRRMPGGGGSVLEALAARTDFQGRAILMTGALGADATRELSRDVHLVRKPFDFSAMVSEVEGGPG